MVGQQEDIYGGADVLGSLWWHATRIWRKNDKAAQESLKREFAYIDHQAAGLGAAVANCVFLHQKITGYLTPFIPSPSSEDMDKASESIAKARKKERERTRQKAEPPEQAGQDNQDTGD